MLCRLHGASGKHQAGCSFHFIHPERKRQALKGSDKYCTVDVFGYITGLICVLHHGVRNYVESDLCIIHITL